MSDSTGVFDSLLLRHRKTRVGDNRNPALSLRDRSDGRGFRLKAQVEDFSDR